MNKYGVIVVVSLLVIVVSLTGCEENTTNGGNQQTIDKRFIARWNNIKASPDVEIWTFYMNGTVSNMATTNIEGDLINSTSWYNFTVDSDYLCFSSKGVAPGSPSYFSECFSYNFSQDQSRLLLSSAGIVIMDYMKIW